VITFGVLDGAKLWLESTGSNLPMFADPERKLYDYLGLKRSVAKVIFSSLILNPSTEFKIKEDEKVLLRKRKI